MLVGLFCGLVYACFGFSRQAGADPVFAFTAGPLCFVRFVRGRLYVCDVRVHHWMFWGCCAPVAYLTSYANVCVFGVVMTLHGLSYEDRWVLDSI